MKQATILQILPRLRTGGVERGTIEIAAAIVKAGGRAIVASSGGELVSSLAYVGGEHITLPLASKNPFTIFANASKLAKVIKDEQVDIIHARSRAPAWSAYIAAQKTKTPFVTTFHGVYGIKPEFKKSYNQVMTKGDRVIAISNFIAEHIKANYQIDQKILRIIHRGVDLEVFNQDKIRRQVMIDLAKNWRLPDGLPIILMPGRITSWKGQHIVVEALAKLPHRNFCCILLGDDAGHPEYRKRVEQLIIKLGLEGKVRIVGNTSSMPEAYMLADLVLSPSIDPEAFGRVPVEAQAMGRIIVASNHGGACETVTHGQTGFLVTPNDSQDLSNTINHILNMQSDQKEFIAEQAMSAVRENFSAYVMCKKTLQVYQELIGSEQWKEF
ncbi:MAG: glycosyltransferase family 4 protein [Pseudomonadota bacterium]